MAESLHDYARRIPDQRTRAALVKLLERFFPRATELTSGTADLGSMSSSEIGWLNGVTAGTGAASKALVLDSSGNVAMPATGAIGLSRIALAATGTDATNAAVITTQVVAVTASDGTKGVALPAAATTAGPILVINTVTTASLPVYPVNGGNDSINAGAEDAAFTLGPGKAGWFIPTSATQWYVADYAAVTATTTELNYVDVTTAGTVQASKAVVVDSNKDVGSFRDLRATGNVFGIAAPVQGAPAAKTVSATLTAAEVLTGIITVNQAGGATSAQQLPTAADMDTALPRFAAGDAFDFSVINTSTVDAEDASVTTNTGWTLVGSMDIHAYSAAGSLNSSARFRARKTGAAAWTLYRLA